MSIMRIGPANRQRYLDNLMVVLIELIIGIRGVLGYVGFDKFWSHADEQAVTLSPGCSRLVARQSGSRDGARILFDGR